MESVVREIAVSALLEVPRLVDRYRDGDPGFVPAVTRWLEGLEDELGRIRQPVAGFAAAQRAQLLAASDGLLPAGVTSTGRRAVRATGAAVVAAVESRLREEVATIDGGFEEPRQQLAQLLAIATAQQALPSAREPREQWLDRVWAALPTGNGAAGVREYLGARLSRPDRLFLLDEALRNLEDAPAPSGQDA